MGEGDEEANEVDKLEREIEEERKERDRQQSEVMRLKEEIGSWRAAAKHFFHQAKAARAAQRAAKDGHSEQGEYTPENRG